MKHAQSGYDRAMMAGRLTAHHCTKSTSIKMICNSWKDKVRVQWHMTASRTSQQGCNEQAFSSMSTKSDSYPVLPNERMQKSTSHAALLSAATDMHSLP